MNATQHEPIEANAVTIFVAGATGATGQCLCALAGQPLFTPSNAAPAHPSTDANAKHTNARIIAHVRKATFDRMYAQSHADASSGPHIVTDLLSDEVHIAQHMKGARSVVQLIGTMRSRFKRGDTYASSDIETTAHLVRAAQSAGVPHFVLLSSVGAGRPRGAYLRAKAKAEAIVQASGIPFTIFRPSMFVGGPHQPPSMLVSLLRCFGGAKYQPVLLEDLARAILVAATSGQPRGILEGPSLVDALGR